MVQANQSTVNDLYLVLYNCANSKKLLENIIIEYQFKKENKLKWNHIINKLVGVERDIFLLTDTESTKILKERITENEDSTIVQNVLHNVVQMTDKAKESLLQVSDAIIEGSFFVEQSEKNVRLADRSELNDLLLILQKSIGEQNETKIYKQFLEAGFEIKKIIK